MSQFDKTLSQGLQTAIGEARVTHALFTTFGFEAEFFEANIVPLLLKCDEGMSAHTAVRRLQLNEKMCAMPPDALPKIEVFFDEHASVAGVPWLPYASHPVRLSGAFHGKVILLRLESPVQDAPLSAAPDVRWVLGCGSANLTLKGWWENIEAWHFTAPFAASAVPADILPDLTEMLTWLALVAKYRGHPVFDQWAADAPQSSGIESGQRFVALLSQNAKRFVGRLANELTRYPNNLDARELEVVSPYFCDENQYAFAQSLCTELEIAEARVWLPVDAWNEGAGLLSAMQYEELAKPGTARWSAFKADCALGRAAVPREPEREPPRMTHAKLLRVPGAFTFMGSVNFSRAAFDRNFEAGFFFDGAPGIWLEPTTKVPPLFEQAEPAPGECANALKECPEYVAVYDWQDDTLSLSAAPGNDERFAGAQLRWYPDGEGGAAVPVALNEITPVPGLAGWLTTHATLPLEWRLSHAPGEHGTVDVWVHQAHLEWRPVPPEIKLDLWSMIDLWRSTRGERIGANVNTWARIEERLSLQTGFAPDAPASSAGREDLFAKMTHIHGAFQGLRRSLLPSSRGDADTQARAQLAAYYLRTHRTDSLPTMLERIRDDENYEHFDEVERWVVLHWIKQIAQDHPDIGQAVCEDANELIRRTRNERLSDVDVDHLDWLSAAFLDELDVADDAATELVSVKEDA
ncbi:MAG TPA: phospholipase D-like domain-containing protein [Paraburkholderia sp.]|uniref:phospholipase D-like domain-containing protein n=1 Tax=Paraburkholderia sp. TaxID=1926495 RepID=UPI002B499471|nr:phospholipase D-like domain-containing protein [Paraburkholderia sp.]HKR38383.1 phospholipase D-like domain-containing protein [Paraburkholderia sp.]